MTQRKISAFAAGKEAYFHACKNISGWSKEYFEINMKLQRKEACRKFGIKYPDLSAVFYAGWQDGAAGKKSKKIKNLVNRHDEFLRAKG